MDCRVCGRNIKEVESESHYGCCNTCFEKVKKLKEERKNGILKEIVIENSEETDTLQSYSSDKKTIDYECKNKIASKFDTLVFIIKLFGYFLAIGTFILCTQEENFLTGLGAGLIIAIITFFSTIFYEAIAEIINILQDIKNKL